MNIKKDEEVENKVNKLLNEKYSNKIDVDVDEKMKDIDKQIKGINENLI